MTILIIVCLSQNIFGQNSESNATELVVEGNILGYESNDIKLFGIDGYVPEYPAIFKITKVLKGEENSQYIIILLKPLDREYADKNFGPDKIKTFRLERRTNYRKKIKHLLHSGYKIENGKVVKTGQTFTFASAVEKKNLPMNRKIQCYAEIDEIDE